MTTKTIAAMILSTFASQAMFADITMVTNVYDRVNEVYAFTNVCGERPENEIGRADWEIDRLRWNSYEYFNSARHGGFRFGYVNDKFRSLCALVSNRCDEIVADWPAYETNDVARFTLISAIGFTSKLSNMTNIANKVLTMYETDHASISEDTLDLIRWPLGTPMEMEQYLGLNSDVPGVRNMIQRLRSIAVVNSNTNAIEFCDECLSGERKRWLREMMAAGALP